MKTIKILWSGLVNAWDGAFQILLANLYFIFLTLGPVFIFSFIDFWPVLLLEVVSLPAAFAGVTYATSQVAASEQVDWKSFFEGALKYFWPGLRWTVLNGMVYLSMSFYVLFFIQQSSWLASALLGVVLAVLAFWTLMAFLTFPFLIRQEKPRLRTALRSALVFILRWPGYSFAFLFPIMVLIIVSLYFPPLLAFLTFGLTAHLGNYAVYYRVESELHPELFRDPRQEG